MGFNDPQVIKNIAFGNRVADLKADEINAPVIGWTFNGGANQQWTLEPEHGKEYKISTTAAGNVVYVSSKDPSAGDNLTVGGESSVYTVQEYNGFYHISIHAEDGTILYWTLSNAANGTKITLKPANNTVNQLWALNPAS
ncbi:ricin B lectin domain-containing protein [Ephemerocybe angulata]|uniref:Ricin B lectin domain-containing protein n=1 Tax=Ephemerocybe angulata TaxID=980116 RepID=A0A8H6HY33_9AGAR|nr:ricin B lectin domain-containing protein [Tulosesus angulatus]